MRAGTRACVASKGYCTHIVCIANREDGWIVEGPRTLDVHHVTTAVAQQLVTALHLEREHARLGRHHLAVALAGQHRLQQCGAIYEEATVGFEDLTTKLVHPGVPPPA